MHRSLALTSALLAGVVRAQQVGTLTTETHPSMSWQKCTAPGSCSTQSGKVVLDSNWRWVHDSKGTNCYSGNEWDSSICSTNTGCASTCQLDGADYSGTYGITASGNSLSLKFVTNGPYSKNIGSRTYLMASDTKYQMFNLVNSEFTFDVDVSKLPCGLNGALYFVSMDADGGMSKYSGNKAGAKYGTGYCDSQCPRDLKFINGEGNVEGWQPSSGDANAGTGDYGSCCAEMDIWEANSISTAVTPHPCTNNAQSRCSGEDCGGQSASDRYAGTCDPDGCDFNSYRQGNTTFYGPGKTINTNQKFTVVTQFIGNPLTEIKRFYVQNGKTYANTQSTIPGISGNSITSTYCNAQKSVFGDTTDFQDKGGLAAMGQALSKGMVLVMSLWDDHFVNMLWLDSTFPTDSTGLGTARGTCATSSGAPTDIENSAAGATVIYSNIKTGPLNSTFTAPR